MTHNFTFTEMFQDIETVNGSYTLAPKKAIAEKYGLETRKAAEIERGILRIANDMRKEAGMVDEMAIRIFNRLWDVPSSSAKLHQAMETETVEFIKAYREAIRPSVERNNRYSWGRINDNRLNIIDKILVEKANSTDDVRNDLISSLQDQTKDFKKVYVDSIVNYESGRFDYYSRYAGIKVSIERTLDGDKVVVSEKNEVELPERLTPTWVRIYNTIKIESNGWDKEVYLTKVTKDAINDYNNNIEMVADRIIRAGMDTKNVKVNSVNYDPKAFEMYLEDGSKRMHCRSIFCAEFSVLVSPHWRFIITNC